MKILIFLSSLLILYFSYGFYISQFDTTVVSASLERESSLGLYDYKGIINVHSNYSLGSSTINDIATAANNSGLDFLILTDLNNYDIPFKQDLYFNRTLLMVGQKLSYLDSRLLYYSPEKNSIGGSRAETQTWLADELSQKRGSSPQRLLILAHPYMEGFQWTGPVPSGLDGIEIYNAKKISQDAWLRSKISTLWSFLIYPFNSRLAFLRLFEEAEREIDLWDQSSSGRPLWSFAGAEASARAIPMTNYLLKFPSYQRSFEFFRIHALLKSELTGKASSDNLKIFLALKGGHFYSCLELLGDPTGFNAWIETPSKNYLMGEQVSHLKSALLKVALPKQPDSFYEIVVFKNGIRYHSSNEISLTLPLTEPGQYRVIVRVSPFLPLPDARKWLTWIVGNPFQVGAITNSL